jgi:hypothetical protein
MKTKILITLSLIGLMYACGPSTKLEKSWIDPSFTPETTKPFTKVLVVAPIKDVATQRIAEDKIVLKMKQGVGVQSYTYLQPKDTAQGVIDQKLVKDGFDGVILMRLKVVEKSTTYNPGTAYYGGWYGYRYAYPGYYSPGYYSEDMTFLVETNFYSVPENKLLWSGTTSTLNPTSLDNTIDEIIYTIKYELQKKGFLKK